MKAAIKQLNDQQNQRWFWWRMAYFQLGVIGGLWSLWPEHLVPPLMKKWDQLINTKSDEIDNVLTLDLFEAVVLVAPVKRQALSDLLISDIGQNWAWQWLKGKNKLALKKLWNLLVNSEQFPSGMKSWDQRQWQQYQDNVCNALRKWQSCWDHNQQWTIWINNLWQELGAQIPQLAQVVRQGLNLKWPINIDYRCYYLTWYWLNCLDQELQKRWPDLWDHVVNQVNNVKEFGPIVAILKTWNQPEIILN